MTFTNRAAGELRERITALVGEHGKGVQAGTFHALCARVLRFRRRGDRARPAVRDLRHRRPAAADEADPRRGGPAGHRGVPAGGDPGRDQPGEERDARRDVPRRARGQPPGARDRPPRRPLPRPAAGRQRAGLRRPAAARRRAVRGVARDARDVPVALAIPARRRVPGHEPAAVPVDPGAGGGPPQPVRGGGRRPVDLRLAGRERPEHPRLRARLPRGDGRQARAELPLHAADPRRGPRRRVAQRAADRQEALDREPGRRADPALRGLQRGGGGRVDRAPDRRAGRAAAGRS